MLFTSTGEIIERGHHINVYRVHVKLPYLFPLILRVYVRVWRFKMEYVLRETCFHYIYWRIYFKSCFAYVYVDVSWMGRIKIRNQIHCKIRGGGTLCTRHAHSNYIIDNGCLWISLKIDVELKTSRSDRLNCLKREFIQLSKFVWYNDKSRKIGGFSRSIVA